MALAILVPTAAAGQTITYGPILGRGHSPDKMIVKWGTDRANDDTTLYYRPFGSETFQSLSGAAARDHEIVLTDLSMSTKYEYYVKSGAARSAMYRFSTCPAPGTPFDVIFYGDSRGGQAAHRAIVDQFSAKSPDMVFHSGDLNADGSYQTLLSEFFPVAKELVATTPFMAAPGNHDAKLPMAENFGLVFPSPRPTGESPWTPYYAFTCAGAMFIGLNSNQTSDAKQRAFLLEQLTAARMDATLHQVFVWFHHSPYSVGKHGDSSEVQAWWVPLLEDRRNKVTAVFTGHDHLYARMEHGDSKVLYVVSGGGGADLYELMKPSIARQMVAVSRHNYTVLHLVGGMVTGTTYDETGTILDTFSATRDGMPMPTEPTGTVPNPNRSASCSVGGPLRPWGLLIVSLFALCGCVLARRRLTS
jgi:hypothetical protein